MWQVKYCQKMLLFTKCVQILKLKLVVLGKGLGRHENGIATAIKPKLKFDNSGIGHDVGEQFTNNWWERVFNSAAENIDVQVNKVHSYMHVRQG